MAYKYPLVLLLALLPLSLHAAKEDSYSFAVSARCGAFVPLAEMNERMKIWLPHFSAALRITPPAAWSRYLRLEIEGGFFAYKAREMNAMGLPSYRLFYKKPVLYSGPLFAGVLGEFTVWKGLYLMPGFGAGMIFNRVEYGDSPGYYNHPACTAGLEIGYRFASLVSAGFRTRAVFAFDRNRVFFHINPDAVISFYF